MDLYKSFHQGKPTRVLSKMLAMMIGKLGGSSLLMYVSNDWLKIIIFLTFFPASSVGGVIYLVEFLKCQQARSPVGFLLFFGGAK